MGRSGLCDVSVKKDFVLEPKVSDEAINPLFIESK